MSRLIDRLIADGVPATLNLMMSPEQIGSAISEFAAQMKNELGGSYSHETRLKMAREAMYIDTTKAKDAFDYDKLLGVPVIAADDVGHYLESLPRPLKIADVVSTLAPPFEQFFVEFQKVANQENLRAWGTLVIAHDENAAPIKGYSGPKLDDPTWVLEFQTFFERSKGHPFGPVAKHYAGIAEDGTWFRHADGDCFWSGDIVPMTSEPPLEVRQGWGDLVAQFLFPVLLTISFMHCKNVSIRPIEPPDKVSKKHAKKTGRPLVRHHVLEIDPLRQVLSQFKSGTSSDLRKALHICRGHFKTFTEDAPLMGRHTGTYWWSPQVRGSRDEGIVVKDYRVTAPSILGRAYRETDEDPVRTDAQPAKAKDLDTFGRGVSAHNKTQNSIAEIVQQLGWNARSPAPDDPEYDIAWLAGDATYVCEVKSLTVENEERQLRMAIGQVIRYRQKLNAAGYEPVYAVIATERIPTDDSWIDLCESEGILLVSPEDASNQLARFHKRHLT